MKPRTYADAAKVLGVERCVGCPRYDHRMGQVDAGGTIHWADRQLVRRGPRRMGLWRFLLLVAKARHAEEFSFEMPRWMRIYLESIYAYEAGRELGLVFTRKEMLMRKIRTSNALRGVLVWVDDRPLARKAADWARLR